MYDRPETAGANDRLWAAIRARLNDGPNALSKGGDVWDQWLSPDLILSQTCGFPYRAKLAGRVTMVGTPAYDIECDAGHYFSVFVARKDDPRTQVAEYSTARFAYNDLLSQSGWAAPQTYAAELGFAFSNTVECRAHITSARMVAEGDADIAALDAISWKMMQRWDDFSKDLKVLAATHPTPGLPLITTIKRETEPLFAAISAAIEDLTPRDRSDLCLLPKLHVFDDADYLSVPTPVLP